MAVIKNDRDVLLQTATVRVVGTTANIILSTGIFNTSAESGTTPASITLTANTVGFTPACTKTWYWATNSAPNTWTSIGTGDTKNVSNTDFLANISTGDTIQYKLVVTEFGYDEVTVFNTITQNKLSSATIVASLLSYADLPASDSDGIVASLPTGNYLRLNRGGVFLTSGVVFTGTATQNGLTLTINSSTGAITLSQTAWTSSTESFILTATYNSVAYTVSYSISKAINGIPIYDPTPPPTPTGLSVSSGISTIFISCDNPTYTAGHGHKETIVYVAEWPLSEVTPPIFSAALEVARFAGINTSYALDPNTRVCIWIKWVSNDKVLSVSPAGGLNGAQETTGQDVSRLVSAMTGPGNPFTILDTPTVIDGVTFPSGTYSTNAFIQDAQITNAKIKNLAVDDAKIANMSVAKLTAGTMGIGAYIQSTNYTPGPSGTGFRINADGTAEMQAAYIRGQITASQIDSRGLSVKDAYGNVILSAGSSIQSQINPYTSGATANITTKGPLSFRPAGADGDFYYATDIALLYQKISGTWIESANNFNNTSQLIDGAGLGYTAVWAGIPDRPTIPDISVKLDKASAEILRINYYSATRLAGIAVGDLAWNGSGVRTSGKGLALTPYGLLGHNGTNNTFTIDATTGDATFGGTLTASAINAVNTINIAGNAVTVPVYIDYNPGAVAYANSSRAYVASIGVNSIGAGTAPVLVTGTVRVIPNISTRPLTDSWFDIIGVYIMRDSDNAQVHSVYGVSHRNEPISIPLAFYIADASVGAFKVYFDYYNSGQTGGAYHLTWGASYYHTSRLALNIQAVKR